jgi:hypothetical protein
VPFPILFLQKRVKVLIRHPSPYGTLYVLSEFIHRVHSPKDEEA